jgi:hypothetical protein
MNLSFRLVYFFVVIPNLVVGQESDSLDFIIELPIKIDKVYNELYVDSAELSAFNLNNGKYCIEIIAKNHDQKHFACLPSFSETEDTLLVIINEYQTPNKQQLLILLTLNEQTELKGFYKIAEQPFSPIVFSSHIQFVNITTTLKNKTLEYNILNPKYHQKKGKFPGFLKRKDVQRFQIMLTTGIHSGVSSLRYLTDSSQSVSSVYYQAKLIHSFNLKLQAQYYFKKFYIGTYFCFENNNYENNTRIIAHKVGNSGNLEYSSQGNWPAMLFHFGICSGYEFLAFDKFLISPTLNGAVYFYPKSLKPFDSELSNKAMSHFKKKYSFGGGLYLKVPINDYLLLVSGMFYQFNHFNSSTYFTDIKTDSFHSRQEIVKMEIGVSLKF